jgi:hypothetical protein
MRIHVHTFVIPVVRILTRRRRGRNLDTILVGTGPPILGDISEALVFVEIGNRILDNFRR